MKFGDRLAIFFGRTAFSVQRRIDFYRILLGSRKIGIPEYQVVQRLYAVALKRKIGWAKTVFGRIASTMRKGEGFAESARPFLPADEYAMLLAGERRGVLQDVYQNLIRFSEQVSDLKKEMIKNVVMITIYIGAVLAIVFLVSSLLVEAVKEFPETRDPMARAYLSTVRFIDEWKWGLVGGVLGLMGAFAWSLPNVRPGPLRNLLDQRVPPWTLYKRFSAAYFLSAASVMLASGEPLKGGILLLRKSASRWKEAYLRRILKHLSEGLGEPQAIMKSHILHKDEETRLEVYEIAGDLPSSMQQLASDAIGNVNRAMKKTLAVIFTTVLLVIGVFIVTTFYAMYTIAEDASRVAPPS